jgi:hypothetical protein
MTSFSSRSTRANRPRLAAVPTKQQLPNSRIATSEFTAPIWNSAQKVFGISAPNNLRIADVQASNRMADAVEEQALMFKKWAANTRKTIAHIAGMEGEKAALVGEVKAQLTAADKALASATKTTANYGAGQRLLQVQTRNALEETRAKSDADVQYEGLSFEARMQALAHSGQIRATNLGRTTAQSMHDLAANNQMQIAAGERARVLSNQRRQKRTGLMALLGAR